MVFEAHERAFRFFGGVCRRGIYDNMKTAVRHGVRGQEAGLQPPLPGYVSILPAILLGSAGFISTGPDQFARKTNRLLEAEDMSIAGTAAMAGPARPSLRHGSGTGTRRPECSRDRRYELVELKRRINDRT